MTATPNPMDKNISRVANVRGILEWQGRVPSAHNGIQQSKKKGGNGEGWETQRCGISEVAADAPAHEAVHEAEAQSGPGKGDGSLPGVDAQAARRPPPLHRVRAACGLAQRALHVPHHPGGAAYEHHRPNHRPLRGWNRPSSCHRIRRCNWVVGVSEPLFKTPREVGSPPPTQCSVGRRRPPKIDPT